MTHLRWTPEYLLTVNIFQSILALKKRCLYEYGLSLEEPVHELFPKDSKSKISRSYGENGYCDISLRNIEDKPLAVIEVKRYAWNYYEDLERLTCLVTKGLKFGIFASCLFRTVMDKKQKEAEDALEEDIKCLKKNISNDYRRLGVNFSIKFKLGTLKNLTLEGEELSQNEELKWRTVCFVISRED